MGGFAKRSLMGIFVALALCFARADAAERLYGLERMERFDRLPCLLDGTQVRQVSSYDRSGGNDDGFVGTYSALYVDANGEHVLFDETGAGCLYRFWMTYGTSPADYPARRLRFYFDNEMDPRLDLSIAEFFDGVGAPLEFPMVGPFNKSSHGCYCYLPFPYRERLKVTLSGLPLFYNMTYHRFDSPEGVVSWTGDEDGSAVMTQWNATGIDPKPVSGNLAAVGNLSIPAGSTGVLFRAEGSGVIQSIKLDPSPNTTNVLANVRIQMAWDGAGPQVDVPLGDFFGSGRHEFDVASLPIGMKTSGMWYCYFPMPFWQSAEIRLVNASDAALLVPFEVQRASNTYERASTGHFHARFNEAAFAANDGQDFTFIEETGRGHLVGISLFMESTGAGGYQDMNYLEGDERAFVDGSQSPCIHGTGNEDYFNCGWYFNQGTFSRPYHGHPWKDQFHTDRPNYTQAYRFHLSDIIPFHSSLDFGIEHGHANNSPGTFSSVAYFYKAADGASALVPVAVLELGDAWSENMHEYSAAPSATLATNRWSYPGHATDVVIEDAGYSFADGNSAFTVSLIENGGLLLRRRTDLGVAGQQAQVFVDGVSAGIWHEADHNVGSVGGRWHDSEFMVSSNHVAGKTSARVSITPSAPSAAWNEYRYEAYCIKPLVAVVDSDVDQLPDEWELAHADLLWELHGAVDSDGDGFTDRQEFVGDTDPKDRASFPRIGSFQPDAGVAIQTARGRLYHLQTCTDLGSAKWTNVFHAFPGTGYLVHFPPETNSAAAYYRLLVEMP